MTCDGFERDTIIKFKNNLFDIDGFFKEIQ